MNKMTVAILALALTGSVAFAQGQGGGGRGGQGGRGNRGAGQQVQPGGAGGAGGAGMAGGMGNFGGGQGAMGGQGGRGGRGGQGGQGGRGGRGGQQGGFGQGGMGQGGFGQGGMGQGGFGQGGMGQGGFGQGGQGGRGGRGGQQGGFGQGGMGQGGFGQGGFGQGGFGQGGMMGAPRNGQLQQTIDRLKAETPREQALKKIEEKDKEAYDKVRKELDAANAMLLELAKKAEIELPETAEQQKARTLEFLAKEKDAIDKLLETDKTDSATAMSSFNELAQKNQITLAPAGRGAGAGAMGGQQGRRAQGNTNTIRQLQEKFPEEYAEIQKLRDTDPAAYRTRMRELQQKLSQAN